MMMKIVLGIKYSKKRKKNLWDKKLMIIKKYLILEKLIRFLRNKYNDSNWPEGIKHKDLYLEKTRNHPNFQ